MYTTHTHTRGALTSPGNILFIQLHYLYISNYIHMYFIIGTYTYKVF